LATVRAGSCILCSSTHTCTAKEEEFPEDVVDAGAALIEEMLRSWSADGASADGDVDMDAADPDPEAQLARLRACMDRFRPQLEANPWVQSLLATL
jgi:DNA mismatch repair protein MSH2